MALTGSATRGAAAKSGKNAAVDLLGNFLPDFAGVCGYLVGDPGDRRWHREAHPYRASVETGMQDGIASRSSVMSGTLRATKIFLCGAWMASVRVEQLIKKYDQVVAVKGMNLSVEDGEFMVFLGPSGCGKTTTLRCIAGLELPDGGTIKNWRGGSDAQAAR